jgi:hypothetical protein
MQPVRILNKRRLRRTQKNKNKIKTKTLFNLVSFNFCKHSSSIKISSLCPVIEQPIARRFDTILRKLISIVFLYKFYALLCQPTPRQL